MYRTPARAVRGDCASLIRNIGCVVEPLEPRNMMSTAELVNGELQVTGDSDQVNAITVGPGADGETIVATINNVSTSFKMSQVTSITINGGELADRINLQEGMPVRAYIYGRGGNDDILTADGNDIVWGGDGDDTINTSGGNDVIYGGDGIDQIDAGAGRNVVYPGDGADWIRAIPEDMVMADSQDKVFRMALRDDMQDTGKNVRLLAQWMSQGLGAGKTIYDGNLYSGQPDLRPYGFTPMYVAYDGTLNRTTNPWGQYSFPDSDANMPAIETAWRRIARAAAGVEPFNEHRRLFDPYTGVSQALVMNLEDYRFQALDGNADRTIRRQVINRLCRLIDDLRDEQAKIGVQSPSIGMFYWPPGFWSGHPRDILKPSKMAESNADFAPLVQRMDAFYPEVYVHSDNLAQWLSVFRQRIAACRAADPNKPIYPFIAPHYGHWADPSIKGKPLPEQTWRFVMETILRECNGAVVWGGADHVMDGDFNHPLPWAPAVTNPAYAQPTDVPLLSLAQRSLRMPLQRLSASPTRSAVAILDAKPADVYVLPATGRKQDANDALPA